jgi:hypothetical protein
MDKFYSLSEHEYVFLPSLKKILDLPRDGFYKDSMGALQRIVKAFIPIITKQVLIYELGI